MVSLYIANTDNGWFDFLSAEPNITEVTNSNGILLRKDIHSVFDAGYATVDSAYRFVVSKKVKEVFDNGEEYRRLHGKVPKLPHNKLDWPYSEYLKWHNTEIFLE
jgi:putative restriction endonuclease